MRRTPAARRRQRSVRVAFAAAVLLVSTAGATTGLLLDDPVALAAALVVSVVCGWAAMRIMVVELRQQRREHARERAAMARSFHHEYAAQASGRRSAQRTAGELEATLRLSDARARHAEQRARREGVRAETAERRVTDLEVALAIRTAEDADELASWDAEQPRDSWDVDTVVDLLSWTGASERPAAPQRQAL